MNMVDVILKKKEGKALSAEEIRRAISFVEQYFHSTIQTIFDER